MSRAVCLMLAFGSRSLNSVSVCEAKRILIVSTRFLCTRYTNAGLSVTGRSLVLGACPDDGSGVWWKIAALPKRVCFLGGLHTDSKQMNDVSRVKRVSVEGNIAVGKSTFARLLQSENEDWEVVQEPVGRWQNVEGTSSQALESPQQAVSNLLQMMYQDPQRWSYTFQTFSCMSRMRTQLQPLPPHLLRPQSTPVQVFERSVYSDRYIFALNMFELGCISPTEWAVYQGWHSFLLEQFGPRLQLEGIIYLRAPPETCMHRLRKRGRQEEKEVELAYLEKLHTQHENWLVNKSTELHFEHLKQVPVLVLDAGVEFERDVEVRERLLAQVKAFFDGL
ncbi:deoxyguanosine kinase, mitochondrial [Anguilla anguilla]|uniref:deoxyguanosine kinase, mitochondrial n=1 Tax=Anguilla anguilla TaxID=7936 RepID=UPI0015A7B581|nr:deoxyguanosine kinase, mitochondrial [Anguilla anguilla]